MQFTATPAGVILGIRVEEAGGSISIFKFSGEKPNVAVSDEDFVFRAPAGTVVVEGLPPA